MRDLPSSPPTLAGSLLLAHPSLLDPNFRRTVLVISNHDPEEGSLGFILNRPTGQTIGDFVEREELRSLAQLPVYLGGPVGRDQLTFAILRWRRPGEPLECRIQVEPEEAAEQVMIEPHSVKAFVGYAGWTRGQLAAELQEKAWIIHPPFEEALDETKAPDLWRATLRELGPWYRFMAAAPDDPSLN